MDHIADLPLQTTPHDALRCGLSTLKDEATISHPVEAMQSNSTTTQVISRDAMLQNVYGSALPAQLAIERQILGRVGRAPGVPSSNVGLEAMTGELDEFGFGSYLGLPAYSEEMPVDMHSQMEAKLKMKTAPVTRAS